MSIEEDLTRQLQAKAASLRAAPDLGNLAGRVRARQHRSVRHERFALGAAVVVLAASLGGLAGALASPKPKPSNSVSSRFTQGSGKPKLEHKDSRATHSAKTTPSFSFRTLISRQLSGGLSVTASVLPFSTPVAITSGGSSSAACATGEIVSTTVGQSGSFGGGTSVAQLPKLGANALEILSSGVLPLVGGSQAWWVTAAVGSGVARVAAEDVGGSPVTVAPSAGIAVIAGPMSGTTADGGQMSAVAEGAGGDESLGFLLGSGPRAVGALAVTSDATGCVALKPPDEPSSASSSQPSEPALAAGSIIAAFEQADSANSLLGFAANLAAVNDGARLSVAPDSKATSKYGPATSSTPAVGGGVDVRQVSFVSASVAEVIYRVNGSGSILFTGRADLGPSGIWRVGLSTFCDNLRSGIVGGDAPAGVIAACEAHR